jgi:preprotein translocase subunit SecG
VSASDGVVVAGAVVVGVVALVVGVAAGVVVGVCVAVDVVVGSVFVGSVTGASVVEVVVAEPSVALPFTPSAAIAPADSGARLAAVMPPPASAEISARQTRLRLALAGVIRRSESSGGRPIGRGSAQLPHKRGIRPAPIHIGRQARTSKGFVIGSTTVFPGACPDRRRANASLPQPGNGKTPAIVRSSASSLAPATLLLATARSRTTLLAGRVGNTTPGPTRNRYAWAVETVLSVLEVIFAVIVVFLVLMHSGKDAGLSGAFGVGTGTGPLGGGSMVERNLNRWTIFFSVLFVINAVILLKRPWA